ncbi:hypothetical protein [Aquamicrobium soli]|uniref:Integrase DNA-binding domain-containing protein n=1 Tax=Aquamicrobium soli TaxID=1811518 RepID=A0ABV7KFI9_9HYPH
MDKPWRVRHFKTGFSAEYLRCGMGHWRFVLDGKQPKLFVDRREARCAAEDAYLASLDASVRSSLPVSEDKIARNLEMAREQFLKSKREDVKRTETIHRPGRKKLIVMTGRAS